MLINCVENDVLLRISRHVKEIAVKFGKHQCTKVAEFSSFMIR